LQVLKENKLFLRPEKCEFCKQWIEYLGLVISENEVSMDPVKVAGVREWPTPKNKMNIQAFLGFVNFYRRFIRDFSAKARPLFDLTCSEQVWMWSGKEQAAFENLKTAVTTAPVLVSPQESDLFWIEADSSNFATGAVLSQQSTTDGKWHLVVFYNKSLSSVERNYEIHDKEMLAIICVLEEWRHFLEEATYPVEIWTDHKNLEYFITAKKLNCRQARWSLHLARFDFLLHHCSGHTMGKPDARWDMLSVDFVVELPESSGHDAVMTVVTPYKRLGKISDILHLNNENNQLKRQARPPKDVPLDAQSWT